MKIVWRIPEVSSELVNSGLSQTYKQKLDDSLPECKQVHFLEVDQQFMEDLAKAESILGDKLKMEDEIKTIDL